VTVTVAPVALRPRTGPEIIDAAVPLLRRAYPQGVLVWLCYLTLVRLEGFVQPAGWGSTWPAWAWLTVSWIVAAFPTAVTVLLYSDAYLGHPIRLDSALTRAARRVIPIYLLAIVRAAGVALGIVCLVVPGIVFALVTCIAVPALLMESGGPLHALRRARRLADDALPRVLAVMGCMLFIGMVFAGGIQVLLAQLVTHHLVNGSVLSVVMIVQEAFIEPLFPAVPVALYYDLRIRQEGLDLELMAQALCAPGAP
jgi:hypothetical protein